jgi:Lon protease-like protein
LFPLHTVLFPGGPLRLRIFEPRYLDMVSRCMREDTGFGVALIVAGSEAGGSAQTVEIGTLARIVDFEQLEDGLLGITARGERRFRIVHVHQESDGLNVCQVEWCEDEPRAEVPPRQAVLAELLRRAIEQIGPAYGAVAPAYEDASWVGMRLAEILPLAPVERQELLELNDAAERLQWLQTRLNIQEVRDESDDS